jgi:AAA+ superfamily predicted ATPase
LAEQILSAWSAPTEESRPVIELLGPDAAGKAAVAALVCAELGVPLLRLDASVLPGDSEERKRLALLWEREALLTGAVLLVDCEDLEAGEHHRVASFLRRLRVPVLVGIAEPLAARRLIILRLDVAKPDAADARQLWQAELGPIWVSLNGQVDSVVSQFNLSLEGIRSAGAQVRREISTEETGAGDTLWRACRSQARPRLEGLAELIEPYGGWDDLVLPVAQLDTLRGIALHLRQRSTVYEEWGFGRQSARGLGFSTLFAGESGTGKTMAAEVLAGELCLDLYRIDLSQVVSKYIGETEKNLGRVFDAAEGGGTILLFDEADALFGKRSEVKDSHDRYANIEVSYLLQRMETYRGLAVLTTNNRGALDQAFLRRLRFVVQFPFPDESQREQIWRHIFPPDVPMGQLDFSRLARLNLTGGNIRNIALNAAFLAADAGRPVDTSHVARAARTEYAKLEKPMPEIEFRRLAAEGRTR